MKFIIQWMTSLFQQGKHAPARHDCDASSLVDRLTVIVDKMPSDDPARSKIKGIVDDLINADGGKK